VFILVFFVFINFQAFSHINITLELSAISSFTAFDAYFEAKIKQKNYILLLASVKRQTTNY
jgi:hypothetical protein